MGYAPTWYVLFDLVGMVIANVKQMSLWAC